jgi:hypothetical protein
MNAPILNVDSVLHAPLTLWNLDVCALTAAKGVCSGSIESIVPVSAIDSLELDRRGRAECKIGGVERDAWWAVGWRKTC